jgi:hypothetical protein
MKRIIAGIALGAGLVWAAVPAAAAAKHHARHHAMHAAMAAPVFTLTSSAFKDNGIAQLKFVGNGKKSFASCIGYNISPPLA